MTVIEITPRANPFQYAIMIADGVDIENLPLLYRYRSLPKSVN